MVRWIRSRHRIGGPVGRYNSVWNGRRGGHSGADGGEFRQFRAASRNLAGRRSICSSAAAHFAFPLFPSVSQPTKRWPRNYPPDRSAIPSDAAISFRLDTLAGSSLAVLPPDIFIIRRKLSVSSVLSACTSNTSAELDVSNFQHCCSFEHIEREQFGDKRHKVVVSLVFLRISRPYTVTSFGTGYLYSGKRLVALILASLVCNTQRNIVYRDVWRRQIAFLFEGINFVQRNNSEIKIRNRSIPVSLGLLLICTFLSDDVAIVAYNQLSSLFRIFCSCYLRNMFRVEKTSLHPTWLYLSICFRVCSRKR